MKYIIAFILSLFLVINITNNAIAQKNIIKRIFTPDIDTHYVRLYERKFMIYSAVSRKDLSFFLRNKTNSASVRYAPNVNNNLLIGILYAGIGFEYSLMALQKRNSENNSSLYGNTYLRDLQLNLYAQQFGIDIISQKYKGFYVSNPQGLIPNWKKGLSYPQRSDLVIGNDALNFYYTFRYKKFSYQAAFRQTRQQRHSAGSFVLMGNIARYFIRADSSIVPTENKVAFDSLSIFKNGKFDNIAVMPGYGYTFVWRKWYISGTLFWGLGLQSQSYTTYREEDNLRILSRNHLRIALGYNTDRFFSSLSYLGDNNNTNLHRLILGSQTQQVKFLMGLRF